MANGLMKQENLSALLIIGNGSVGGREYGYYRYFVNNRVYYHMQAFIAVVDDYPSICCGSATHLNALKALNFNDIHMVGDQLIEGIIMILKTRSIERGRIGFCLNQMPTSWYDTLTSEMPGLTLIDVSGPLYALRAIRSIEEQELVQHSALLAEKAYQNILRHDLAGTTENALAAEIGYFMKYSGAEEALTRIAVGQPGAEKEPCGYLHHAANSRRVLAQGECAYLEIAPKLEGYWAQICRTIPIGEPTETTRQLFRIARECLDRGASLLRPGTTAQRVAQAMSDCLQAHGCPANQCYGGVCGIDLLELPIIENSSAELVDGMSVVVKVEAARSDNQAGVWLGEVYQVSPSGGIRLDSDDRSLISMPVKEGIHCE